MGIDQHDATLRPRAKGQVLHRFSTARALENGHNCGCSAPQA